MRIHGLASIAADLAKEGFFVKCIATPSVAVFFPGSTQHRDVKQDGASYEDDYQGNAMAVTIVPGRMDVRYHERYPDDMVSSVFKALLACPELDWAREYAVYYQGRPLG